jgi:hypothetical protein
VVLDLVLELVLLSVPLLLAVGRVLEADAEGGDDERPAVAMLPSDDAIV